MRAMRGIRLRHIHKRIVFIDAIKPHRHTYIDPYAYAIVHKRHVLDIIFHGVLPETACRVNPSYRASSVTLWSRVTCKNCLRLMDEYKSVRQSARMIDRRS